MITQFYSAGSSIVKVVIEGDSVKIYDANLARRGVSAEQILERDSDKMEEWNKFMMKKPTERKIADEIEKDFKDSFGFRLTQELIR